MEHKKLAQQHSASYDSATLAHRGAAASRTAPARKSAIYSARALNCRAPQARIVESRCGGVDGPRRASKRGHIDHYSTSRK